MAELSNEEKLKSMLAVDKKTFEMLASMRLFLADPKSKTHSQLANIQKSYTELSDRYNSRQDDYKNNPVYTLGNSINDWSDNTVAWFKETWENITTIGLFGLGVAPALVVPIAIAAGATLTTAAVAYFIYKYYSETSTDYNEALGTIELLARHNPELAEKMLNELGNVKKNENETGLFNQVGVGLKWGLAAVGVGVGGIIIYKVGQQQKWF